jgi:two-component system, LuxR family, response regulator FixJ
MMLMQLKAERVAAGDSWGVRNLVSVKTLIYIVEDDPAIRDSLKLLLEMRGHKVEAFACGADLLGGDDTKRCEPCDCLILDVNLPGDDGFEVLAKLRQRGVDAPAIFVSGRCTAAIRARAKRANVVAFFEKPVQPSELFKAIDHARQHK